MLLALHASMFRVTCMYVACFIGACLAGGAARAQAWQSLESIRAVALAHVRTELPQGSAQRDVEIAPLDPRLHLAACDATLSAFTPPGARRGANGSVGVRCTGSQPWKIYVSARVTSRDRVLVANRALPRNAVLTAADLTLVERDVDTLSQGYLRDAAELDGTRLRRPVAAGAVLTPSMLACVPLGRRRQPGALRAQAGGEHSRAG